MREFCWTKEEDFREEGKCVLYVGIVRLSCKFNRKNESCWWGFILGEKRMEKGLKAIEPAQNKDDPAEVIRPRILEFAGVCRTYAAKWRKRFFGLTKTIHTKRHTHIFQRFSKHHGMIGERKRESSSQGFRDSSQSDSSGSSQHSRLLQMPRERGIADMLWAMSCRICSFDGIATQSVVLRMLELINFFRNWNVLHLQSSSDPRKLNMMKKINRAATYDMVRELNRRVVCHEFYSHDQRHGDVLSLVWESLIEWSRQSINYCKALNTSQGHLEVDS